jgi:murein DD-endopeptidase MepM/ murein hydrolase activator NlpD
MQGAGHGCCYYQGTCRSGNCREPGGRLSRETITALIVTGLVGLEGCVTPEAEVADSAVVDSVAQADVEREPARDTAIRANIGAGDIVVPAPLTAGQPVTELELAYLRGRRLLIPVPGVPAADLPDTFDEARSQGRRHDAIDIAAPRGTAVLSVDHGRIARIDTSDRGGLSLYTTDPSGRFVYYYAHLDRYRNGLRNDMPVARGDTLGFVGTTGNAPPDTPHLHFAINRLDDPRRWWDGTPINPRPLLLTPP